MRALLDLFRMLQLWLAAIHTDEAGQDLAEYGLIIALIAIVAIAALTVLGTSVSSILASVAGAL